MNTRAAPIGYLSNEDDRYPATTIKGESDGEDRDNTTPAAHSLLTNTGVRVSHLTTQEKFKKTNKYV